MKHGKHINLAKVLDLNDWPVLGQVYMYMGLHVAHIKSFSWSTLLVLYHRILRIYHREIFFKS